MQRTRESRILAVILAIAMIISVMPVSGFAATNSDGYIEIRTIEELYNVRNNLSANYILMNDIDLSEATAQGGDWDFMGNGWNPIGSNDVYGSSAFSGVFDGNGHKITGLRIKTSTTPSGTGSYPYVGLFAKVTGTVKNLTIDGDIWNTYSSGYAGSITAYLTGTIENCFNNASVRGYYGSKTGGLAGCASSNAKVYNCANTGDITVTSSSSDSYDQYAGGIVGYASSDSVTISKCYNTGKISAMASRTSSSYGEAYAAGISNGGKIDNCYNAGEVEAKLHTSASSGYTYAKGIGGTATNCYNVGTVTGSNSKYAISDLASTKCYYLSGTGTTSTGATALTESQMLLSSLYTGFDFDNVWVQNTAAIYPYPQLIDNPQYLGVIESVELLSMPSKTVYAYGESLNLSGAKLKITLADGNTEEVAVTNSMVRGFDSTKPGTQTITVTYKGVVNTFEVVVNPIVYKEIRTIEELYNIRNDLSANYILMNDIDLSEATALGGDWDFMGNGWNPIGSNDIYGSRAFSGVFDGNGHKITGLRIKTSTLPSGTGIVYAGLFAKVTGTVKNLTIDGDIWNTYSSGYAGSITAYLEGTIENCFNNASVKGYYGSKTGGLAGYAYGNAKVYNCANTGDITVTASSGDSYSQYAGGIVGSAAETTIISKCYNTGKISAMASRYSSDYGKAYAAGISNGGKIDNCYNAGEVEAKLHASVSNGSTYAKGIGGTATNCYNVGTVTGGNSKYAISDLASTNCYYLTGTGTTSTGATALTESQMRLKTMYVGFDFDNVWVFNSNANHPYPQLLSNVQDLEESASLVSIISLPVKTEYMVGENLALDGCVINVEYVSGKKETINVTSDMVSGYDKTKAGQQVVTVKYGGCSDTFTVTVTAAPEVSSVELISAPDETEFRVGTAFDFTGAKVEVKYSDGTSEVFDVTYDMTTGGNINHLGKQTITVAFGGKSVSFNVTVTEIAISNLKFASNPDKLTYLEGQELDLSGMVLQAVMNTGEIKTVTTGYSVKGYSSKPGTHKVTIEYMGKTIDFEVVVTAKSVVELTLKAAPEKTSYFAGEPFDPTGMMIVAKYDNGDVEVVEDYVLAGYSNVPGLKTVTASYGGKYVAFSVTVVARVITEFKITSYPAKLEYIQYEPFDITGLVVKATYNDGKVEEITDYTVVGFSSNIGVHTISVAYQGMVETFDVEVSPRVLTNLVVQAPEKLTYSLGESFDATGMIVTACYNNGQQMLVSDYTISGFDSESAGIKTIVVTYGDSSSAFCVLVNERSQVNADGSFAVGSVASHVGDTITVPVSVFNNTGIAGFTHKITFDATDLEFKSLTMADGFKNGTLIVNDQKASEGELIVLWFDVADVSDNGDFYNLTFDVRETAKDGDSAINISFEESDHGNIAGENVIFAVTNGTVNIRSYWQGDVDGDRVIGMADLLQLAQYIAGIKTNLTEKQLLSADVNEDGKINIHDIIMLQQWLLVSEMNTGSASLLSAGNEEPIEFSFGEAIGATGEEVVIPVMIKNNPGFATYRFRVSYDKEALEFVSAESGEITKKGSFSSIIHADEGMMTFLWYSTTEASGDGEIALLKFKVIGEVAGRQPLYVTSLPEDVVDFDGKMLSYEVNEGKIVVASKGIVTNTVISDDGKVLTVNPVNIQNNEKVILALYKEDQFVEVQTRVYTGQPLEFTTDNEYTQAVIMVWDSFNSMRPLSASENVSK